MRRAPFGVDVLASFAGESRPLGERAYRELAARLQRAAAAMLDAAFASTGAQVLVSIDNMHSMVYATAGYPAITVPLGLRAGGIPAGITLIGRRDSDARLLAHAHAFEGAASLRVEPRLP
jgi:amidase